MEQQAKRTRWLWVVGCVLMPVLYVLSIGPTVYIVRAFKPAYFIITCLVYFYFPLEYLHEHEIQPFRALLDYYVTFWERLAGMP